MNDPTAGFFDELQRQGHVPLMETMNGTLRFDVMEGERAAAHWFITIRKGDVTVSHENSTADCVVKMDRQLAVGISKGEVNAFAAVLRGEIRIAGDPEMMVVFQRLFPGPTNAEPVGSRS